MDEYDVFMDEGRRLNTLTTLQEYAMRPDQLHRQFIIITPNNLSSVRTSNAVRIIKLNDPVRQTAHGLQQQTL